MHLFEFKEPGKLYYENNEFDFSLFDGVGQIGKEEVRCLTKEAQVLFHQGYKHDENDEKDVLMLCEKYGIPVPDQYKNKD